jgi:hypothetical protein
MTKNLNTTANIAFLAADCFDGSRNATARATVNIQHIAQIAQLETTGTLRRELGNALCSNVCVAVKAQRIIDICKEAA